MILTVTPNAAVDKTYRVEEFTLDRVNRPSAAHTVAGGKGINVARVYQTLGGEAVVTGFLGGIQGQIVAKALAEEKIENQCVSCEGETRLCIAVIDPTTGTQTEINESGPEISARSVSQLQRCVKSLLSQQAFDFVVLSGSLPPNAPDTLYAELIILAREAGVPCVLDSSSAALREGIAAVPWMVKPNRVELAAILERPLSTREELLEAGRALQERGIALVAITLGKEGALLVSEQGCYEAVPPEIEFASAVASGDSFIAAFLWAWQESRQPANAEYALRVATGAGAANAAMVGAGFCSRDSIFSMADKAGVHAI